MDLASFIVGLVVAWIIALLIYWFGVQREETERIANSVPLNPDAGARGRRSHRPVAG